MLLHDGNVESYTKCNMLLTQSFSNLKQKEKSSSHKVVELLFGGPEYKAKMNSSCYTVSQKMCQKLKEEFNSNSFDTITKKHKKCTDFTEKIQSGLSEDFWQSETNAKEDINHLMDEFIDLNDISYPEIKPGLIEHIHNIHYNSLSRGGRAEPSLALKRVGEMLNRCKELDLYRDTNHSPSLKGQKKASTTER